MLRARGHDRVEVIDAAVCRTQRYDFADRYLPFHSSPTLALPVSSLHRAGQQRRTRSRRHGRDQLKSSSQVSMLLSAILRHMMSLTPLWSKSPTSTSVAPAGCAPRLDAARPLAVLDQPQIDVVVRRIVPHDIAGAVLVEVANTGDLIAGRMRSDGGAGGPLAVVQVPDIGFVCRRIDPQHIAGAVIVEVANAGDIVARRVQTDRRCWRPTDRCSRSRCRCRVSSD